MKRRVARLLESGVPPQRILPVTFTKVAAEDLHRELVQMDVEGCDQLAATTLHSLALRGLMRAHVLQATGRAPRPLNDFERKPLEADLARTFGGLKAVRKKIKAYESAWARQQQDEPGSAGPRDLVFEQALLAWLHFHRAMLIGEVIPIFLEYLKQDAHAPERTAYDHILVDEYQDLNRAEQDLIGLMAVGAEVCIVGDDDQSIYSFKHAHPQGIRAWGEGTDPGPSDVAMSDCQRCPARIVRMANSLISRNVDRNPDRQLNPMATKGEGLVRIIRYGSVAQETQGVANIVDNLLQHGMPPGQILVLAQRDVLGTPIYEALIERDVPTKSYYAEAELDTEFVQERYAYLRLLSDTDDRVALRWLIGLYGNNWNESGYRRVRTQGEATGLSPWSILNALVEGGMQIPYSNNVRDRFEEVRARIDQLRALMEAGGVTAIVEELFPPEEPRVRDIRGIMVEALAEKPDLSIQEFLGAVNDAVTKPEIPENVVDVRVMSIHKSKGLSSAVTIIAGCVEGLLPKQPAEDLTPQEVLASIEEQRRLLYVGITRVKADVTAGRLGELVLTSSREMPRASAARAGITPASVQYGQARLLPSRFLSEFDGNGPAVETG